METEREKEVTRRKEVSNPKLRFASGFPLSAAMQGGTNTSSATGRRLRESVGGSGRRRAVGIAGWRGV